METVLTEILFILFLIVVNGFFAMSEIAILTARRERLQLLSKKGDERAKTALELSESDSKFLSAIQIGITLVSILAGVYSGATIAQKLSLLITQHVRILSDYATFIGFSIVVVSITFLTLLFGELVPKQIGRRHAEVVAMRVAQPMKGLLLLVYPFVMALSSLTTLFMKLLGAKNQKQDIVSDEELILIIEQGTKHGIFEEEEKKMVEGVFELDEISVAECMVPVTDVEWIDTASTYQENLSILVNTTHTYLPVAERSFDQIHGVLRVNQALNELIQKNKVDFLSHLKPPIFIPENTTLLDALNEMNRHQFHFAFVVTEYGSVKGIITSNDVFEQLVGGVITLQKEEEANATCLLREDGSYLVDGTYNLEDFAEKFNIPKEAYESIPANTVAGLSLYILEKIPKTGDKFEWHHLLIEIVDMDGKRIDKLLVKSKTN
ncbi:MAG: hemolysin family protein [bacterium]|nr:hemolysin family protein [bacterium]